MRSKSALPASTTELPIPSTIQELLRDGRGPHSLRTVANHLTACGSPISYTQVKNLLDQQRRQMTAAERRESLLRDAVRYDYMQATAPAADRTYALLARCCRNLAEMEALTQQAEDTLERSAVMAEEAST